jgi:hypothetical protein
MGVYVLIVGVDVFIVGVEVFILGGGFLEAV